MRQLVTLVVLLAAGTPGLAAAEPLTLKAVMSPKEQIYADLPIGDKHFVLFVRREGKAIGGGSLNGAEMTEYGMHDIRPGVDGSPRGYMIAKLPNGDQAVLQWEVQATFVPGPMESPVCWTTACGASSAEREGSRASRAPARCISRRCRPRSGSSRSTGNSSRERSERPGDPTPLLAVRQAFRQAAGVPVPDAGGTHSQMSPIDVRCPIRCRFSRRAAQQPHPTSGLIALI